MNEEKNWDYKPDGKTKASEPQVAGENTPTQRPSGPQNVEVQWEASEYIEHNRNAVWYLALLVSTGVISAATYYFTKEIFATVVIILTALAVTISSFHKPRQTSYSLSKSGLMIGQKNYPYSTLKSFAVIREGGLISLNIVPIKKFMPTITVYFESKDEEKIINSIGQHLPYEERSPDRIERLSQRLKL